MDLQIRQFNYWFDRKNPQDSCFLICTLEYSLSKKQYQPLSFVINRDNKLLGYVEKIISEFKGYIDSEWIIDKFDKAIRKVIDYAISRIIFSEYIDGTYIHEDGEVDIGENESGNRIYAELISDDVQIFYEDGKYITRAEICIHDSIYLDEHGDVRLESGAALTNEEQQLLFDIFDKKLIDDLSKDEFLVSNVNVVYEGVVDYIIEDVDFFSYDSPTIEIDWVPKFNKKTAR